MQLVLLLLLIITMAVVAATQNGTCDCFNCMLTDNKCLQYGQCSSANGKCECPVGFGAEDCSRPLCQSLAAKDRVPLPQDQQKCQCDDGWGGYSCNMCQRDDVCQAIVDPSGQLGANATCYTGGKPVHNSYQTCKIRNKNLLSSFDKELAASIQCSVQDQVCRFALWADYRESFYCMLEQCNFEQQQDYGDGKNVTGGLCRTAKCECIKGELLCGKKIGVIEIDLTETLRDYVKGPASFICKRPDGFTNELGPYNCEFDEIGIRENIGFLFGKNPVIELDCVSGECLHPSEVPGFVTPVKPTNWALISTLVGGSVIIGLVGGYLIYWLIRRMERERTYRQLGNGFASAAEEEEQRALEREIMQGNRVPACLVFKNITYEIMDRGADGQPCRKRLLRGIHGVVRPGEIMAIMGSSGAGKTSCLDILAGRPKKGIVTGKLYINNKMPTRAEFKQITGYVDQEDSLLPTLTVYETLLCSALLRLPRTMSYDMKVRRVRDVLAELGIEHIANTRIGGNPSFGSIFSRGKGESGEGGGAPTRGISGGERRRVSIALEIIPSPSLLYADEPTSGLDAYNAYSVIHNLKRLAVNYGRTVVLSLHQPRSDIFGMFDRLLLLGEGGYMVYSGKISRGVSTLPGNLHAEQQLSDCGILSDWLASMGVACPPGFNIADYIIDLCKLGGSIETMYGKSAQNDDIINGIVVDASRYYIKPVVMDIEELAEKKPHLYKLVDGFLSSQICRDLKVEMRELLHAGGVGDLTPVLDQRVMHGQPDSPALASQQYKNSSKESLHSSQEEYPLTTQQYDGFQQQIDEEDMPLLSPQSTISSHTSMHHQVMVMWHSLVQMTRPSRQSSSQPGFWTQFRVLSWRVILNFYRNPFLMYGHYGISILLALMCGTLFWQIKDDLSGFQNRLGIFFFILAVFGFASLSSLEVFSKERALFIRERSAGYYGVGVYFITKILFDILPLRVVPPILLGVICYYMIGLAPGTMILLKFLSVLVLFNLSAAGICLVIAVLCGDHLALANLVAVMWMLFSMLFGGFLLNKNNIHPYARWLPYLSFYNYAFEALIVNELSEVTLSDKQMGIPIEVPGTVILKTFGFEVGSYWSDTISLAWMALTFMLAALLFLQLFVKEKR